MKIRNALILFISILIVFFCGCAKKDDQAIRSFDDLDGKRIGVVIGTIHDKLVAERFPNSEIVYYNNVADSVAAINNGDIAAFARSLGTGQFLIYENPGLIMLDEHLTDSTVAYIFPKTDKGDALRAQVSEFIVAGRESGELDRLRDKWFDPEEDNKIMPDIPTSGPNGTLTIATTGVMTPYNYIRDNELVGLEIELTALFAMEYGYGLEFETMNFDGVLAATAADTVDMGTACLAITPERQESVNFSEPYIDEAAVLLIKDPDASDSSSFIDKAVNGFTKTFIRENRYKLFIDGILLTLEINVLSILFGTVLGSSSYLICRRGGKISLKITKTCIWLIQGMPVIVLLLICYYIIFSKFGLGPITVSIISFSLIFAASVYNMLDAGVRAIGPGQTEAAYALGFSDTRAFFKVILPQAMLHILPSFRSQVVALLKATAVVGYISVDDLTRAGDIVRSRTYEPFFSLIAVAVMYFVLAGIINSVTGFIQRRIDPEKRSEADILKGVDTK